MSGLILDTIIAMLLFVTVIYCIRLSKKIAIIHEGKEELRQFIQEFNQAIVRAEDNISQLRQLGGETNEKLQEHVKNARFLANDLSFLMEKGQKISHSLEHNISMSRSAMTLPPKQASHTSKKTVATPKKTPQQTPKQEDKVNQIESLLNEVKNLRPTTPEVEQVPAAPEMTAEKRQALDDALSQISSRQRNATPPASAPATAPQAPTTAEPDAPATQEPATTSAERTGHRRPLGLSRQRNNRANAQNASPQTNNNDAAGASFDTSRLQQTLKTIQSSEKK